MKAYVVLIIRLLAYFLSGLFPRRSDLWAFGCGWGDFTDNSKYLFLWISANRPDIKAVWITGNAKLYADLKAKGYRVELRRTVASILVVIRAKLHVFCYFSSDVYFPFSKGCLQINLWHGVGIKNLIHASAKFKARSKGLLFRLRHWDIFRAPDMFLSTSEMMSQHFSKCFRIPIKHCPQIGYPRLDVVTDDNLRRQALTLGDYASIDKAFEVFDKIYLYMPTFRDSGHDFVKEAFPDLRCISQILASENAALYVKLHRSTAVAFSTEFDNCRKWPDGLDIYPVLKDFDVLITDYSSILYDWIFLKDNGVILYAFDYDRYTNIDRDLAFSFNENTIGVTVSDFESLCAAIRSGAGLAPLPKEKLALLRERFWGKMPPFASRRLTDYLTHMASLK